MFCFRNDYNLTKKLSDNICISSTDRSSLYCQHTLNLKVIFHFLFLSLFAFDFASKLYSELPVLVVHRSIGSKDVLTFRNII